MSVSHTSTDAVPAHALRRGTRGFAAVVLFLTGMIVFAVTAFVLPSIALPGTLLTALILLGIGFGIAHLVAIYGVLRRRPWAVSLTLYLLAIGLGLVAFGSLLLLSGRRRSARAGRRREHGPGAHPGLRPVRLAGRLVDRRRAVRRARHGPARAAPRPRRSSADRSRVMVAHPLVIAADATRRRTEFLPHSA